MHKYLFCFIFIFSFSLSGMGFEGLHGKTFYLIGREIHEPIIVKNSSHLTFDCNNSRLTMSDPTLGILKIYNSKDITIKNCVIDYSIIPHVAGKIENINKREIIFKPFKSYADHMRQNIEKQTEKTKIYAYPLQAPGIPKRYGTGVTRIRYIEPLKGRSYRLHSRKIRGNLHKGDTAVVVFRTQGSSIVFMRNSRGIHIRGVTVYASPAADFVAFNTSKLTIRECKVLIKDGRWISSNADGVHIQSSRGNITIDNNIFEGLGDDGVNLYTKAFFVQKDSFGYFLWRSPYISEILKIGDPIYIFDWRKGKIRKTKIIKISKEGKKIYLSFNPQLIITPEERLYDMNLVSKHFRITDNVFRNSRRFGLFLKAHQGVVMGNSFENLGGSAIIMKNANPKYFNEGLNCEEINVTKNRFGKCGFGLRNTPTIEISMSSKRKNSFMEFHKNILMQNNSFSKVKIDISNITSCVISIDTL